MPKPNDEAKRLIAAWDGEQRALAEALTNLLKRPVRPYTLSKILNDSRTVKADELDALRQLIGGEGGPREATTIAPRAPRLTDSPELIPLYGAVGPFSPFRLSEDYIVGQVPIHPAQKGSSLPFSFVAPDDRVAPRICRGEIGYALRNRPPAQGQVCLVETDDGAFPYFYDREDATTLYLRVRQPREEVVTVSKKQVVGLHVVVGATFGIV
jgi:hypothetical protein